MKQYQSDEIKELSAALCKAQSTMPHALKETENTFFKVNGKNSTYADLAACQDAAKPHLLENGLEVSQVVDFDNGIDFLVTMLTHTSGQWRRSYYPIRVKDANNPQQFGAGVTYARRFSYCAIIGLTAIGEDDDGNMASGNTVKKPEPTKSADDMYFDNQIIAITNAETLEALREVKKLEATRWSASPKKELIYGTYNDKLKSFGVGV